MTLSTIATTHAQHYTPEQQALAEHLIALEREALDLWFQGQTSGYRKLWSQKNFSYCDGAQLHRIDEHGQICEFLDTIEGKLFADSYEFVNPRIQFGQDMALLTYELYADTTLIDMKYNCIELFQKEEDGVWRVIHSTWSFIRPMDMDFSKIVQAV
ncbi:nuclear transport factor 2 family protein [Gallibacterium melopsittaci]|uniref:Nuclear transport factor 2 family protein n=1 Tax=Gallibacterium melopsittaci TaxID=516063 RepID=A0ABV6HUV5_9PAST